MHGGCSFFWGLGLGGTQLLRHAGVHIRFFGHGVLPVYPLCTTRVRSDQDQKQICFSVGGLPAMQTTRCIRYTQLMPSQASQLPHLTVPALAFDLAFKHSSRPVGRCALDLLLILILGAPLNHAGRTQALERG
ncbi:hypothetical protein C0058_12260 [Pseudomonas sp. NC02]|nr:hypothetical protein C0058_12260 [Pseudomonas sp. NC02]